MLEELVLITFVWGMIAFAVAIDAGRRGRHGGFWAILTLFTGLFGALIYGLVVLTASGPTEESTKGDTESAMVRVCPDCSSKCDDSQNYCDECGAALGSEDAYPAGRLLKSGSNRYCSNCKSKISRESSRCPNCGAVF